MGKKTRRRRTRSQPRLSPAQLVRPGEQTPLPAPAVDRIAPKAPTRTLRDLREEYPYVVADLKRIALIAAVMLAVLIGLAVWLV
ncbi:MAG: hypothetical protein RML46_07735 [Anaerolineae bacterium]|nr:hypothetical protein [Anaerolineae bacterium]MDW8068787.1 hypothetical protein [Anaerolineae bacterium]